jgi:predicted XRE-type DNA-binding protein
MPRKNTKQSSRRQIEDDLSANVVARSELMISIAQVIQKNAWTQAQAAELLGVAQPRISDLMQGRVDRFTVDMLMIWLQKLGKDVSVQVRDNVFSSAEKVELILFACGAPDQRILDNVSLLFGRDPAKYSVKHVDVLKSPEEAKSMHITSTPCLVKVFPEPLVTLTGDLSAASVRWQLAVAARNGG